MIGSVVAIVLAALLLAAHMLRAGQPLLALVALGLLALLAVRRPWAGRTITVVLALGALEWLRTMLVNLQHRTATGQPFGRMVLILAGVALFTAAAARLSRRPRLRAWFAPPPHPRTPSALAEDAT